MSPAPAGVRVVGSGAPTVEPEEDVLPDPVATREPRRRPPLLTVVLAVLALAGVFGTVFSWSKYRALASHGDQQRAVARVSQHFLLDLTNFQANNVDAQFAAVSSLATGDFAASFQQYLGTGIRASLAKVQAVSRGQVRSLYVETLAGETATVFAVVDQTIANMNFKQPEPDTDMIELSLRKVSAGWRVSEVTVLQGPAVPAAPKK